MKKIAADRRYKIAQILKGASSSNFVDGLSKMELKDYLKKTGYYVDQDLPHREALIKMLSDVHGISDDSKSQLRAESWSQNILNRKDLSIEVAKAYKRDKPDWDKIEEPGKETRTPTKGY